MSGPFLAAQGLSKAYRSGNWLAQRPPVVAVTDLSISLARGETLGLVGESGCGKSTVGRLLLGIKPADAGSIAFEGAPMPVGNSPAWRALRRRMQLVHQDPVAALDRRLTVGEQVAEPLHIHGVGTPGSRMPRAKELLGLVGLSESFAGRLPNELSGGQRQRVVLARALATSPDLLVCDEPISALDVSIQAQIVNLFGDIQRELRLSMVFISHDLRAIRQVSNRVAVMYLGRIVEEGAAEELLAQPLHPYTRALISAVPNPRTQNRDRITLKGDPPNPSARPSGCEFHPRCPLAVAACRETRPALKAVAENRKVACHLVTAAPAPAVVRVH